MYLFVLCLSKRNFAKLKVAKKAVGLKRALFLARMEADGICPADSTNFLHVT